MFNDLSQQNPSQHSSVDDIFAETDKTTETNFANQSSGPIETQRVGLTAEQTNLEQSEHKNNNWFKFAIIGIIGVIFILAAYLVYSKFIKAPVAKTPSPQTNTQETVKTPIEGDVNSGLLAPVVNNELTPSSELAPIAASTSTEELEPAVSPVPVDSDGDGLTDDEENIAGTNINVIDTDNDGLSDYEEIVIYKTNPLNADTDNDTYKDGQEVLGGYNPNGTGKLPGNVAQ